MNLIFINTQEPVEDKNIINQISDILETDLANLKDSTLNSERETSSNQTNNIFIKEKRLINCEICNENQSKYTCPKCLLRTCSLECIKKHKELVYILKF